MQLYGLRMKTGAKIQDHLRKLDELSDQLAAIGEEVSEGGSQGSGTATKRTRELCNTRYGTETTN